MKRTTYVSYVIQGEDGHCHASEILNVDIPAYSYSPDTVYHDVVKWAKEKEQTLNKGEKIIIENLFKI